MRALEPRIDWPHSPTYWKLRVFFAPKRACSIPHSPHDARGCGETGMNKGSIRSGPPPICLWWDALDMLRLWFPFPLRNQCDLQLFVNIRMLKRLWHRSQICPICLPVTCFIVKDWCSLKPSYFFILTTPLTIVHASEAVTGFLSLEKESILMGFKCKHVILS